MGSRRSLLWQIEKAIAQGEIRSIPDLRSLRPDISKAYPKLGFGELQEILEKLRSGKEFPAVKDGRRKASSRDLDILELRKEGKSYAAIGRIVGLSRERVRQICSEEERKS